MQSVHLKLEGRSTGKAEREAAPLKAKFDFIEVDKSTCTTHGGVWRSKGLCYANWKEVKSICKALGGRLLSIEELWSIITSCGGVVGEQDSNEKNRAYQLCYKSLGFTSSAYWSATTDASDTTTAWAVYFDNGYDHARYKTDSGYVRCVRAGQ